MGAFLSEHTSGTGIAPRSRWGHGVLLALGAALCSCYTTQTVSGEELRRLGHSLDDVRVLRDEQGQPTLLDGASLVQATIQNEGGTDWVPATSILVSSEALYFEHGTPTESVASATVWNISEEASRTLASMAPPGGTLKPSGRSYVLTTTPGHQVLPWAARFVSTQSQAGLPGGRWRFSARFRTLPALGRLSPTSERRFRVPTSELREALPSYEGMVFATGARWPQVSGVDVNSLDPFMSAMAVPLFPLALLAGPEHDGREKPGSLDDEDSLKLILPSPDQTARPLFSWNGKRRGYLKLLVAADGAATWSGDLLSSVQLGLRMRRFFEFSAMLRQVWPREQATGFARPASLAGVAMGLHIDRDGDPRFALYAGVEILPALREPSSGMASLAIGPRIGLVSGLWASLVPLGLTRLTVGDWSSSSFFSSIQLGGAM